MINNVVLVGRLTKDVELKQTQTGVSVARFGLAVNRPFTDASGEKKADFLNIVVWRKQAENAANYLQKGSLCGIVGRIETGSYEGQDGKRVYTTDIVAESVQFLDSRKNNDNQQGGYQQNNYNGGDQQQGGSQNNQNQAQQQQQDYWNNQNGQY